MRESAANQEGAIDLAQVDDASFQRFYTLRIEPCFRKNEAARAEAVKTFNRRLSIGIVISFAAAAVGWAWSGEFGLGVFIAVGGAAITAAIAYHPLAKVGEQVKREYCAALAEALGAGFTLDGFDPPALERLKRLKLVPSYDRSKFEDWFAGTYKDARFDLYEGHLERRHTDSKGRTRYSTAFRGQLIRMHFPREFAGVTIARRDAGFLNMFGGGMVEGKKLERVGIVDARLERAFEVWGTDQVEARYLLHPVMLERLLELETRLHGKRLRCAFEAGDVLIAVEGGNLFEPGDLFKPLADPARARRIVEEISGLVRVMDQVLTAQSAR